jgi:hypothetical protein
VRSNAVGRALVVCAGVALGHPWAMAARGDQAAKPGAPMQARVQKVAAGCSPSVAIPDESFQSLQGVRDATVWVDDIDSGLSGRFSPFEVYVVTGKVYAPFQLKQGKLGRDAFRKLTSGNYNAQRFGPLVVPTSGTGQLPFVQDGRQYTLRVLGVTASTFNRDTLTVQVCW